MESQIASGKLGIAVAGDLLRIHSLSRQGKGVPLFMEFSVNPETGPFLVSSSRSTLWVTPRVPKVRAAFRPLEVDHFFAEVVGAVAAVGREAEWGNVQPFTPDGLLRAVAHLRSYGLEDLEVLAHPEADWGGLRPVETEVEGEVVRTILGLPLEDASWLDTNTIVVVPQDKDYVGFLYKFGNRGLAVVHNASRGVAVCQR
jgi:hypothetical protein